MARQHGTRPAPPATAIGPLRRRRDGTLRGEVHRPDAVEGVLVDKARHFRKTRAMRFLRPVLGNGIFLSEGETWRRNRRLIQPAFARHNVDSYAQVMVRRSVEAIERWAGAPSIDTLAESRRLTLLIAVECLFGAELTEREVHGLGDGVHVASSLFQRRVSGHVQLLLSFLPTPATVRTWLAVRRLHRIVDRIIAERRRDPARREDLLALLEAATDPEVGAMDERQLRDEVNTLLLSGHETTALGLTWTLYELARHPSVDAELAAEIAAVIGPDRRPDASDVAQLPIAASIVKEALRLYPPLYVIGREPLVDVEIGGLAVKKGSRLRFNSFRQQRDATVFEGADEFRPERWRNGEDRAVPRGSYFPFGMGPRMCVGSHFATVELVLVLVTLRQRYRIELASPDVPLPVPRISLQPDRPIRIRLVAEMARDSHHSRA